jgi:hypothetical protein
MAFNINGTTGLTFNNGSAQDVGGVGTGGQTWQNVTATRTNGVTYTNTTGKPIMVAITATVLNTGSWYAYVSGVLVVYNNGSGATSNAPMTTTFIVPNGANYSLTLSASTLVYWIELR